MEKTAYITGVNGQDGSFLSEFLLEKGYKVYGLMRRTSQNGTRNIQHLLNNNDFEILHGDVTDLSSLINHIKLIEPDEIYHLAAQSDVRLSFEQPISTMLINAGGTLNILEAVKTSNLEHKTKIYHAATSELFGNTKIAPQNEKTPFHPRSPYSVSKMYGYWICENYKESYNMFACSGILFNHESERRGENFVTQKIAKAIAEIYYKKQNVIELGDIDSKRDWGHSQDYVEAMWLMLQKEEPSNYVIASGETHSVEEFIREAFKIIGINDWNEYIQINEELYRPAEVPLLLGDYSKAKKELGWEPKTKFKDLVKIMVGDQLKILGEKYEKENKKRKTK